MAFNIKGARDEGYTDAQIAEHLAAKHKFDYAGAKKEGYDDTAIAEHLAGKSTTIAAIKDVVAGVLSPNDDAVKEPTAAAVVAEKGVKLPQSDNVMDKAYDLAIDEKYKQAVADKSRPAVAESPVSPFRDRSAELDAARKAEADGVQQASDILSGKQKYDAAQNHADVILNEGKDAAAIQRAKDEYSARPKIAGTQLDYNNPVDRAQIQGEQQRAFANANPILNDTMTDAKAGLAAVPGAFVGLVDIAPALILGKRPADQFFNAVGDATGVHPGQYAENLEREYSDIRKQGKADISAVWDDETKTWWDLTKAYANNPGVTAGSVIKSLPSMVAGGAIGRVAMLGKAGLTPVTAGAFGEGSVMAGQQMNEIDKSVNPRIAALTSLATGVMGALVGKYSGAMASKLGIRDVDTILAGGSTNAAAKPFYIRIPAAMVQEGIIEEGSQSAMEVMLKNIAEGKPVTEGLNRAVVEGILAGSAMGGAFSIPGGSGAKAENALPPAAGIPPVQPETGDIPADQILGAVEPEVPHPNAAPGSISSAANIAAQQGITPIAEVINAQVQPDLANQQSNISPAGSDTNVLPFITKDGGRNADNGNGNDALGIRMAATGTEQSGNAASVDAGLPAAQSADNVAQAKTRPIFNSPHEERVAAHIKQAAESGDSQSVIDRYMPKDVPDDVTGFAKPEEKKPTVERARKFVENTGETAHYIDADIANLGGINNHFNNNSDESNKVYRGLSDIFKEEMEKAGNKAVMIRHGGDEISAVVIGGTDETIQRGIEAAHKRSIEYAKSIGLDQIPYGKRKDDPTPYGTGIYLGYAKIEPGKSNAQIFEEASTALNEGKKKGINHVRRNESNENENSRAVQGRPGQGGRIDSGLRQEENARVGRLEPQAQQAAPDTKNSVTSQNEVSGEHQRSIENLIRNRKVAGQFGLAPELDAVIRAIKASSKGEKLNRALLKKIASKFERHSPEIATEIRSVLEAGNTTPAAKKEQKPSGDLIQRIKQLGGINKDYIEDFGAKDAKFNVKSAFKQGGESPDFIAQQLKDEGYPLSEDDLIGGLSEFVRRYVNGERTFKHREVEDAAMSERDDLAFQEMIPEAEKYGINWRKFNSPDDLYIAITKAEDAKNDAEEAALDVVLGDNDITLDDIPQSTDTELNAWLSGENNAKGNTQSTAGTATGKPEAGSGNGAQGTDGAQTPGFELESQTNAEIARKEAAAAKAKAEAEKEAPSKNVTSDQVDMFNTQGGIFNQPGTSNNPVIVETHADLKQAEQLVNTDPTDAQKEAGNYTKGHIQWNGLDISIENPAGSERSGTDQDGEKWSVKMPASYGYIKHTEGADGEHIDVYIGKHHDSKTVFIIDQQDTNEGEFDEHKVMLGFPTQAEAERTYKAGFSDGKGAQRMGPVSAMSLDEFKSWIEYADTKKPVVKTVEKPAAKAPESNLIMVADIPKDLKLKIGKKLVDARNAMKIANQRVEKLEALKGCMS